MRKDRMPKGMKEAMTFSLVHALIGRRARRFVREGEIPEGTLAYSSRHNPLVLAGLNVLARSMAPCRAFWCSFIYRPITWI